MSDRGFCVELMTRDGTGYFQNDFIGHCQLDSARGCPLNGGPFTKQTLGARKLAEDLVAFEATGKVLPFVFHHHHPSLKSFLI